MADFTLSIKKTLPLEGGTSDNKNDNGLITKYGISLRFLRTIKPNATADDIINLTVEDAENLYKEHFWKPIMGDRIKSQALADSIFDMAVNMGVKTSVRLLQRSLLGLGYRISVDGIMGLETLSSVNSASEKELLDKVMKVRIGYYARIAELDPSQKIFLKGWTRRARLFV